MIVVDRGGGYCYCVVRTTHAQTSENDNRSDRQHASREERRERCKGGGGLVGFIGSTGSDSSWCMLKRRGVDTEFRLHVLLDLSSLLGVVHTRDRLVLCVIVGGCWY